jgi:hypothetical protein
MFKKQETPSDTSSAGGGEPADPVVAESSSTAVEETQTQKPDRKLPQVAKPGDYSVRVHIIEARELKGRGVGEMSDPVVIVEMFGAKKSTTIKKSSLNCVWDEVMVFSQKNMDTEQLEMEKIRVMVYDANSFRRNVLIGAFDFDMSNIYYREDHELYRKWAALTDTNGEFEGIQGYLKVSISVLGPGDQAKNHDDEEDDDDDEDSSAVIMPPMIQQMVTC